MNVPKQAKFVNGDARDVFGIIGTSAYTEGADYPNIFRPAVQEGGRVLPFYKFPDPALNNTSANGMYNWFDATSFSNTKVVNLDATANVLTTETLRSGIIYPGAGTDHKITINRDFYTYPNPFAHSTDDKTADNTQLQLTGTLAVAVCEFTVTVKDWDTGKIVGQFNNETSEGSFEF